MRVLVTGASGLIGRRVVARLVERGDEVVALSRGTREIPGAPLVTYATADGPIPADALDGVEAIVNLAGESVDGRWSAAKKEAIVRSRVDMADRVVEAIAAGGPRVLVNASAIGYYGSSEEPVDEDSPSGEGFLAETARAWEAAALAARDHGARVAVVRIGVVLARDGGALPRMITPFKLMMGGPLGSGKQWYSWVHVDDVAGILVEATANEAMDGPLNATAPGPVRQAELAKSLGRILGRPSAVPTPAFVLRAMLGEMSEVVLSGAPVMPRATRAAGYEFRFDRLDHALRAEIDPPGARVGSAGGEEALQLALELKPRLGDVGGVHPVLRPR